MTLEEEVVSLLREHQLTITTAESCTGGLIAGTLINVAGVSEYLKEAYITYSDEAKEKLLGVDPKIIETYTVVSQGDSRGDGVRRCKGSRLQYLCFGNRVSTGPDGGSLDQPVGLVYIGCAINDEVSAKRFVFEGDRQTVRKHAVTEALCFVKEKDFRVG